MVRFVYEPSSKIVSSPNRGAYHLWGVTFPEGVPVAVEENRMIRKCRALAELREVSDNELIEGSAAQSAALPKVSSAPDTAAASPTFELTVQPRKRGRPRKG